MRRLAFAALLVVAACGDGYVDGPGPDSVPVSVDRSLEVGWEASVQPGLNVGIWKIEVDGLVVALSRWRLFGDEAGTETRIDIDFGENSPTLLAATSTNRDADGETNKTILDVTQLVLNNADLSGIISGRLFVKGQDDIDFWANTQVAPVSNPQPGDIVMLVPGGVLDGFSYALQYEGIIEDSRCPADVTCITAGTVSTRFGYVDESGRTTVTATGIATPSGPAYGDHPRIDLAGSLYVEVLGVTTDGVTMVVGQVGG